MSRLCRVTNCRTIATETGKCWLHSRATKFEADKEQEVECAGTAQQELESLKNSLVKDLALIQERLDDRRSQLSAIDSVVAELKRFSDSPHDGGV